MEAVKESEQRAIIIERIELKKIVIVIGGTGTGKSTIINMLYNDDFSSTACIQPCSVNYTADSVTKEHLWHLNPNGYVYGDTVGFNDPSSSDLEIAIKLKEFVKLCAEGVHCIIVVLKFGRVSREERINLQVMSELFESRWVDSCILVLTHYEEGGACEKTQNEHIDRWLGNDEDLNNFVKKIKRNVFVTNNSVKPLYEPVTRVLRENCLQKLRTFIDGCSILVRPAPLNMIQMLKRLIERLLEYTGVANAKKQVENIVEFFLTVRPQAGTCPICFETMEVTKMAQAGCLHQFHMDCLTKHLKQAGKKCPLCRRDITKLNVLYPGNLNFQ